MKPLSQQLDISRLPFCPWTYLFFNNKPTNSNRTIFRESPALISWFFNNVVVGKIDRVNNRTEWQSKYRFFSGVSLSLRNSNEIAWNLQSFGQRRCIFIFQRVPDCSVPFRISVEPHCALYSSRSCNANVDLCHTELLASSMKIFIPHPMRIRCLPGILKSATQQASPFWGGWRILEEMCKKKIT